ncbi:Hypothetical protein SMAX5B_003391 [Scophthalmus maximus]|uniref:Uncharacterized protein n=1 Tax=Scophthalmus maximus TaxID=52904 RepID=A0A2U9CL78_SCOMX|nr:Hypothetical protein SMAX5B_003391 [Scophthalmus maximus]
MVCDYLAEGAGGRTGSEARGDECQCVWVGWQEKRELEATSSQQLAPRRTSSMYSTQLAASTSCNWTDHPKSDTLPDRDHLVWWEPWSEAPFTPAVLVRTKLRSPEVRTKQDLQAACKTSGFLVSMA